MNKYKIRMNGKLYEVKVKDKKTKDEASIRSVIQQLIDDEASAIGAYNIAIENLSGRLDAKSIAALKAIRDDEERHSENLFAIMSGNVTEKNLQDSSIKDALVVRLYKSPLDDRYKRVQLLFDGREVGSLTSTEAKQLASKISMLANSATDFVLR